MIQKFRGINISSKDLKQLKEFYHDLLGIPMLSEGFGNFDGSEFGFSPDEPVVFLWDENKWGTSSKVPVQLVYSCDNLDKTYDELKAKEVCLDPPATASWGGREMMLKDPDGNKILLLEG